MDIIVSVAIGTDVHGVAVGVSFRVTQSPRLIRTQRTGINPSISATHFVKSFPHERLHPYVRKGSRHFVQIQTTCALDRQWCAPLCCFIVLHLRDFGRVHPSSLLFLLSRPSVLQPCPSDDRRSSVSVLINTDRQMGKLVYFDEYLPFFRQRQRYWARVVG